MTTKLQNAFKRELDLNGEKYTLTVTPEGFKLVPKGVLPLNSPQQPSDFKGITNPSPGSQGKRLLNGLVEAWGSLRRPRTATKSTPLTLC